MNLRLKKKKQSPKITHKWVIVPRLSPRSSIQKSAHSQQWGPTASHVNWNVPVESSGVFHVDLVVVRSMVVEKNLKIRKKMCNKTQVHKTYYSPYICSSTISQTVTLQSTLHYYVSVLSSDPNLTYDLLGNLGQIDSSFRVFNASL
jgi:hypothetical protein